MVRRFFTRILMVALIGFCGYNWFEIRALKTEVTELRSKQAVTDKKLAAPTDWKASALELARQVENLQRQARQLRAQADSLWRKVH